MVLWVKYRLHHNMLITFLFQCTWLLYSRLKKRHWHHMLWIFLKYLGSAWGNLPPPSAVFHNLPELCLNKLFWDSLILYVHLFLPNTPPFHKASWSNYSLEIQSISLTHSGSLSRALAEAWSNCELAWAGGTLGPASVSLHHLFKFFISRWKKQSRCQDSEWKFRIYSDLLNDRH